MAKTKLLSAIREDDRITISLDGKAKPGKLKAKYFNLTGEGGNKIQAYRAEYSTPSTISVTFEGYESLSGEHIAAYDPPKKDKKKGVIQSKSGKDAKSWRQSITLSPSESTESEVTQPEATQPETAQDPLTNAWTYNGHTYQLITSPKSWDNARQDAITQGGYLAEINDSAENAAIYAELLTRTSSSTPRANDGGDSRYVWLGGTDAEVEGQWIWSNSRQAISTGRPEWGRGSLGSEPDNSFSGQDALAIGLENWPRGSSSGSGYGNAGQWNDINGSNALYYIIEYDAILPLA